MVLKFGNAERLRVVVGNLKKYVKRRELWIWIAAVVFAVEMVTMLFLVFGEKVEIENFLAGKNYWCEQMTPENPAFCQEFKPEYSHVKSIGLFFGGDEKELGNGYISIAISDKENNTIFNKDVPYAELKTNEYMDIDIDIVLEKGKMYYLSVEDVCPADGKKLSVGVNRKKDESIYENKRLWHGYEEIAGGQMLIRYCYTDAFSKDNIKKVIIICILTALGIVIKLPEKQRVRSAVGIILLILGPCILGRQLELLAINPKFMLPFALKINIILLYILELLILLCIHSLKYTVIFFNTAITILYTINYFVYTYRGVPLRIGDLKAIGTAAKILGNYNFQPNVNMGIAWGTAGIMIIYGLKIGNSHKLKFTKRRLGGYLFTITLAVFIVMVMCRELLYTDLLLRKGFSNDCGFDQYMIYQANGYLVATCFDIMNSRIEEPEGYSAARAEEILKDNLNENFLENSEDLPHIILIMNESWSDLRVLGNLELNKNNFSFTESLKENTIKGYVNASVIGGGTANSEFEVFTGCTMGFLPASHYAYQQWMVRPADSLISIMKDTGYSTWSIHPENAKNWNRKQVYQYLGFDHSLWQEDFTGGQIIHNGLSDWDTYYKVEEIYENRQMDEHMFIFDLTMQNHGGYTSSNIENTIWGINVKSEEANTYLSLMNETDQEFEQLIHYFEKEKEKVIICMFGDHQPLFADSDFYDEIYKQTEDLSDIDKVLNQYKTPFLIWANYDIPEAEELDISMNYLGVLLLKTAQIKMSPYFNFLADYMEEYPIITVNGYLNKEGDYFNWSDAHNEMPDYRILQYNYLFDKNLVKWGYEK